MKREAEGEGENTDVDCVNGVEEDERLESEGNCPAPATLRFPCRGCRAEEERAGEWRDVGEVREREDRDEEEKGEKDAG